MKLIYSKDIADKNERIDQYLSNHFEEYSRSKISRLIKLGKISVNSNRVKPSYLLKEEDTIELSLDDFELSPIQPQNIDLEIVYNDDDIAVINKPVGMLSHPTHLIRENTLVNALLFHFPHLSSLNGEDRPGIVHRLDFNTSGLMVIAKTDAAFLGLKKQFEDRKVDKGYLAIVKGRFNEDEGCINLPIGRNLNNRKFMAVNQEGKEAITCYKVIRSSTEFSYLDVRILTGRTHQIRVHLSHINHPILGDKDYGGYDKRFNIDHQLLQAYYLAFHHPITSKYLEIQIDPSSEIKKYHEILFKE